MPEVTHALDSSIERARALLETPSWQAGSSGTRINLQTVIDTLGELGAASVELVAWELDVPVPALQPHWDLAIGLGLLKPAGRCPEYGEQMYSLVA
jgi:hypothetical protein